MKKVIFICLLSLSICLSAPNGNQVEPTGITLGTNVQSNTTNKVTVSQDPTKTPVSTPTPIQADTAKENENPPTNNASPKDTHDAVTPTAETKSKPEDDKAGKEPNKEDSSKPTPSTEKPEQPTALPSSSTTSPTIITEKAKPTTTMATNVTTTTSIVNTTPAAPTLQTRAFDGPSFIGGIILTLGLLAIGFMGFKYYKNQTERTYRPF